jgi:carboxybiotin decarboxylase
MALVPVLQPPIMRMLTNDKERVIKMKPPRTVSKLEKILFPIMGLTADNIYNTKCTPTAGYAFLW